MEFEGDLNGMQSIVLKIVLKIASNGDANPPTPQEVTEYLKDCTSNRLPEILNFFHQRWPDEEVWPPGTILPDRLTHIYLCGGILPPGTKIPSSVQCRVF